MATAEWDGYHNFVVRLEEIANPDPAPLLEEWKDLITEGNRRGVLRGLDGFNRPMTPLKYRTGKGKAARVRKANYGTTKYATHGENLTTAEYQKLTGPRLAPRGEKSRAIANLVTGYIVLGENVWEVSGTWDNVWSAGSKKSPVKFLPYHFDGLGHLPRYDLRPVRPEDIELAALQAREWITAIIAQP